MKKILSIIAASVSTFFFFLKTASAQLLTNTNSLQDMTNTVASKANYSNIDIGYLVARIILIALGFLGLIFVILMIVAGFRWMTAAGNEEEVKKAQGIIRTAIIGLVIVLTSYAITFFIMNALPFSAGNG